MLDSDGASLFSLLKINPEGIVWDLIRAIFLLGPEDMLRRSLSSLRTRCNVLCSRGLAGTGRLVAAPGREGALKLEELVRVGFDFCTGTGPPSLRLIIAQRSGRRAEKLQKSLVSYFLSSMQTYKGTMTSTQKSLGMLSVDFICSADSVPFLVTSGAFEVSKATDCQIQSLSM